MIRWIKVAVFISCLVPLALLLWKFFGSNPKDMSTWGVGLGANPIEKITHATGDWTLKFLLITLSITPLRKLLGVPALIKFRRMFGLFAFFYGCLHFTTYIWLDKFFSLHEMLADVAKRKFITVGFTAFVLLIPPAGRKTLAGLAPADLRQRDCRGHPLFVAGESRYSRAVDVWSRLGRFAVVPHLGVDRAGGQEAARGRCRATRRSSR
jgi:hypothetical protein